MTSAIRLDGREWPPETYSRPALPSLASGQGRATTRGSIGPSALLGMAAMICTSDMSKARANLRSAYDFSALRANQSVKLGAALTDIAVSNSPLGYLAGVQLSSSKAGQVMALLTGTARPDGAPSGLVSYEAVNKSWRQQRIGRLARMVSRTGDRPSQAVCAALLASRCLDEYSIGGTAALVGGLSETFMGPKNASQLQHDADRVLAAAYAICSQSSAGLDLGSQTWNKATADWRFRAAPWLLPLLDEETSPALVDLLYAAHARGVKFVEPGQSPFNRDDSVEVTEQTRDLAVGNAANLTKWTDWPIWFSDGADNVQVLLTQDETYAYAWVGRNMVGQVVAFDTTDFIGWGLDEPGMTQSLAYAIAWYIDVSVSLRKNPTGTTTVRRAPGGSQTKGYTYKPTPTYVHQRSGVAQGTHSPPTPHMRAAHVRNLVDRNPSQEALSHVPAKFRRQMGPHDTWVRSAKVGGAASHAEVAKHLSTSSALANVLGLMDRLKTP